MKNSIEILLFRIKTQSTRKSRASDAKHLLEGDLEIIEKLVTEALDNLATLSPIISESERLRLMQYIVNGKTVDEIHDFTTLLMKDRDRAVVCDNYKAPYEAHGGGHCGRCGYIASMHKAD